MHEADEQSKNIVGEERQGVRARAESPSEENLQKVVGGGRGQGSRARARKVGIYCLRPLPKRPCLAVRVGLLSVTMLGVVVDAVCRLAMS